MCTEIHTKYLNTLCGQDVEFVKRMWHVKKPLSFKELNVHRFIGSALQMIF